MSYKDTCLLSIKEFQRCSASNSVSNIYSLMLSSSVINNILQRRIKMTYTRSRSHSIDRVIQCKIKSEQCKKYATKEINIKAKAR